LACGERREILVEARIAGECPRCGYVGWAASQELSERVRKLLRDVPLELRGARARPV
jgi:hypothetical protein